MSGCHEGHSAAPPRQGGLALQRQATPLAPPPWGTESISYERFAQPVLDRYCVRCHQGQEPGVVAAEPAAASRTQRVQRTVPDVGRASRLGKSSPWGTTGIRYRRSDPGRERLRPERPAALTTLRPMQYLSCRSRLIELAVSGKHYDVQVDPLSQHRLIAWVDACCPFMGEEELRALGDPDFPGIEGLPIRPRVATAPVVDRP